MLDDLMNFAASFRCAVIFLALIGANATMIYAVASERRKGKIRLIVRGK